MHPIDSLEASTILNIHLDLFLNLDGYIETLKRIDFLRRQFHNETFYNPKELLEFFKEASPALSTLYACLSLLDKEVKFAPKEISPDTNTLSGRVKKKLVKFTEFVSLELSNVMDVLNTLEESENFITSKEITEDIWMVLSKKISSVEVSIQEIRDLKVLDSSIMKKIDSLKFLVTKMSLSIKAVLVKPDRGARDSVNRLQELCANGRGILSDLQLVLKSL